ncbi:putative flavo protein [Teratosphaeria nubilosa]|uniref:Putative flavo protein n=1 Tax=Teratosphaeria nubilosa TaxID=161662 RepID=A0A6G1L7D1_9PEZI|nr:putative flavo protein [Teratosphaeria nubilosa]
MAMGAMSTTNGLTNGHSHPSNWVPVNEQPVYSRRPLKIVAIGAGFSGLTLAHKIKHEHKLEDVLDLVIYEKNADVGGTWFENRYPGAACDIPAHAYTFPFEPNPDWSHFYAPAPEIEAYIKRATRKWNLDEKVQFNSKVISAKRADETGKWKLVVDQAGTLKNETCDILVNACGFLNKWKWPKIDGLHDFKGKLVHTAQWDDGYGWEGKRVAVIGNGSSGIQTVAAMAPKTARLVNFVRNPTWISVNFLAQHTKNGGNFEYTEDDKKKFKDDPKAFLEYRKELEGSVNAFFFGMYAGHPAAEGLKAICISQMKDRMKKNPELAEKLIPEFRPGCRRLSPGDGYLEAFELDHVHMNWDPIQAVTPTGVKTSQGEEDFDMIVAATGFDTSFVPPFELVGRNGATLNERWAVDPDAFFSVQVDGMPNYFIYNGPNCVISHGSVLTNGGFISDYILKWVKKIATEDIKSIDVKSESVSDFNVYTQEFLKRMAWADKCRSWYKNGKESGQVTGTYGGSFLHFKTLLENLGAEHFNFTYNSPNRFRFLGNGEAIGENMGAGDMAWYMDDIEALRLKMENELKL